MDSIIIQARRTVTDQVQSGRPFPDDKIPGEIHREIEKRGGQKAKGFAGQVCVWAMKLTNSEPVTGAKGWKASVCRRFDCCE